MSDNDHYLRTELYELVEGGPLVFDFLREGCLDGVWYWNLENRQNEWMSPRFWKLLGYDPDSKEHLASEWQDIIFKEDLPAVARNFNLHCEDPSQPYDQCGPLPPPRRIYRMGPLSRNRHPRRNRSTDPYAGRTQRCHGDEADRRGPTCSTCRARTL